MSFKHRNIFSFILLISHFLMVSYASGSVITRNNVLGIDNEININKLVQ